MCTTLLPCPLCSLPRFSDLESLRIGLIKVATENLVCPVCNDILMGLDKLTIHLFSHCENDLFQFKSDKNVESEESHSIEKIEPLDATQDTESPTEETQSTNAFGETAASTRKKNKTKIAASTLADNSELLKTANYKSDQRLTVFNINTIPFIGIPENISSLQKCKKNAKSPSEKSKNGKSDKLSEKCDICGFYFLGKNILEMHKKLIHNVQNSEIVNGVSKYCCHLCSKVFKMRGSLMVHLRMVHFGIIPSVKQDEDSSQIFSNSPGNVCDSLGCDTTTINTENINGECGAKYDIEALITNNKSPEPNDIYNNISGSNSSTGTKQWTCDICNKQFTTKYFLKKHKRLHTGEMPYSCSQCNKTFTFQQSYHKHLLYHNDDKPHQCSHCGRAFKELSTLHNHQRIHTGEKPFSCETCGKCFRQRVSYLVHRRIHTGVMPYKCTACEKSFRYKVSQRTHKCTAQPPGTIVRQSGDLVQKLIKNQQETENNEMDANNRDEDVSHEALNGELKFSQNFSFGSRRNSESGASTSQQNLHGSQFTEDLCQSVRHPSSTDTLDCGGHLHSKNERQADEKNIIDELVSESILKMDFSHPIPSTSQDYDTMVTDLYSMISPQRDTEDDQPSPSENFKNLKLSPPTESILEDIVSESIYAGAGSSPVYQLSPSNSNDRFVKNINDEEFVFNNSQFRNSIFQRR